MASEVSQPDRLLSFPELRSVYGIRYCRMQLWRLERELKFPKRIIFSSRHVAWKSSEIEQWIAERAAARDTNNAEAA